MKTIEENLNKILIGGRQKICPDEVIMLKADVNYTEVHLCSGKMLIVATTLKALEKRFSNFLFFRTHKSYLINLRYVLDSQEVINKNVLMQNDFSVEISRRKKTKFRRELLLI